MYHGNNISRSLARTHAVYLLAPDDYIKLIFQMPHISKLDRALLNNYQSSPPHISVCSGWQCLAICSGRSARSPGHSHLCYDSAAAPNAPETSVSAVTQHTYHTGKGCRPSHLVQTPHPAQRGHVTGTRILPVHIPIYITSLTSILVLFPYLCLALSSGLFHSVFWFKILYIFFMSLMCATWTIHLSSFINLTNSVALVREQSILTERPPLVGEVSANSCG
jgi:hypothetical protein